MENDNKEVFNFYREALNLLTQSGARFMLGGAFAIFHYTGIFRNTKDLDIFCKATEYPKILKFFEKQGFRIELTDVRWLAKIFKGEYYIDVIFDSPNNICKVDDTWYEYAVKGEFEGINLLILPAEEMIWSKIYVQNRERFDGADVNHVMLKYGKSIDWKRLLMRLDQHWHVLLAQLIMFQFVYPSEYREIIPKWLFDDLIEKAKEQYDLPSPVERVCRGILVDQTQYSIDVKEWGYKASTIKTV